MFLCTIVVLFLQSNFCYTIFAQVKILSVVWLLFCKIMQSASEIMYMYFAQVQVLCWFL